MENHLYWHCDGLNICACIKYTNGILNDRILIKDRIVVGDVTGLFGHEPNAQMKDAAQLVVRHNSIALSQDSRGTFTIQCIDLLPVHLRLVQRKATRSKCRCIGCCKREACITYVAVREIFNRFFSLTEGQCATAERENA